VFYVWSALLPAEDRTTFFTITSSEAFSTPGILPFRTQMQMCRSPEGHLASALNSLNVNGRFTCPTAYMYTRIAYARTVTTSNTFLSSVWHYALFATWLSIGHWTQLRRQSSKF